ncbi:hypothetical protein LMIY3S_04753 [Labrys miyagiensis]
MIRYRKHAEASTFTALDWIELERLDGSDVYYEREADGKLSICQYLNPANRRRITRARYIERKYKSRAWEDANPDWQEQVARALDAELLANVAIANAGEGKAMIRHRGSSTPWDLREVTEMLENFKRLTIAQQRFLLDNFRRGHIPTVEEFNVFRASQEGQPQS